MGTEEFFKYLGLKDQEDRDRFSKMAKLPLYDYDPERDKARIVYYITSDNKTKPEAKIPNLIYPKWNKATARFEEYPATSYQGLFPAYGSLKH